MLSLDAPRRVSKQLIRTDPVVLRSSRPVRSGCFGSGRGDPLLLQRDPSSPNPADPLSNPGTDPDHAPQDLPGGKPVDAPRPENEGMPQNRPSPDQQHPLGPPEPIERSSGIPGR
jgi:hypothetical protein